MERRREPSGKHIIFRVFTLTTRRSRRGYRGGCEKPVSRRRPTRNMAGELSPDYNDPTMVAAMERLIAALLASATTRIRASPSFRWGLLGFWGEWHTWPREEMYATTQTERRIIDAYRKAFPRQIPDGSLAPATTLANSRGSDFTTICFPKTPTTAKIGASLSGFESHREGPITGSGQL